MDGAARLSQLRYAPIDMLGRYTFPVPTAERRPSTNITDGRTLSAADEDFYGGGARDLQLIRDHAKNAATPPSPDKGAVLLAQSTPMPYETGRHLWPEPNGAGHSLLFLGSAKRQYEPVAPR